MQNMAGTMQNKLITAQALLDEAIDAKVTLTRELQETQEAAKEELENTKVQLRAQAEEELAKLKQEHKELSDTLKAEMAELKQKATVTQNELEASLKSTQTELKSSEQENSSLKSKVETLEKNFDAAAAGATLQVERQMIAAAKKVNKESLLDMEETIRSLKLKLAEAETQAAEAMSQAELRLAEEVSNAVSEATMEAELLATEASMAADSASQRAASVELFLQHQTTLIKSVSRANHERSVALEALETAQQNIEALENQKNILQDKMSEAEAKSASAEARAATAEQNAEKRSVKLVEEAQHALKVATKDRDEAVKATLAAKQAAESAIEALTKRAESAEHQLQWQADVLARCDKAESAMREAELKAQALMEEVQTLKTEVESLRASQAESSQRAVELDAELQAAQSHLDDRIEKAEVRVQDIEKQSMETVETIETNTSKKLDNAKTEIEQITAALEMSKQKLGMHDVNSERNILALRKALATTSSAIDTWKQRAVKAETHLQTMRRIVDQGKAGVSSTSVSPGNSHPDWTKTYMETFDDTFRDMMTGGRALRYLSGTERRQLLARGPRVENSQDSVSMGSTWDMTEDEGDDMLYTREVRDFGVAAGIVAPPRQ